MLSDRRSVNSQQGITLIELVITIVILGIALTGVAFSVQYGVSQSADTTQQVRAVALAQAYLDEILGKRFDENTRVRGIPPCRASAAPARQCSAVLGPDGVETRATYDDVDDYHDLDEGDGQGVGNELKDALGVIRTGYDNFRVQVDVRYVDVGIGQPEEDLGLANEINDQFDAKLITVEVTYRGLTEGFKFSAYKSNF